MKHSGAARVTVSTALVLLDLAGRLALPAALLALTHGLADAAFAAALGSAAAGGARSVLLGWWTERSLVQTWRRVVEAARAQPPATLKVREQGEAASLVTALREVAIDEAQAMPRLASLVITLAAVAAAVGLFLGPAWLAFGGLGAAVLGGLTALGRRRLYRAYERAWREFTEAARDTGMLIEASAELRAHAREESFAAELLEKVDRMARQERFSTVWQAVLAFLPAGLAVAAVAGPVRAGASWAAAALGSADKLADVGILGGTALVTALSLASTVENAVRAAPLRRTLDAFIAGSALPDTGPRREGAPLPRSLALATIAFEDVSCVHAGAPHATPAGVSYRWSDARGLAVSGANGAGKSTLALALLGLVAPSTGRVTVDGIPLDQLDLDEYRQRVVYLSQGAFLAPGESVAWHLRILAGQPISNERVDAALAEVALLDVLEEHAARRRTPPRDVPAGELSGGERQRMHLARVLLHDADLVILDEPEVALDHAGRALVRALLERLAEGRRVLVIAHDDSIVPPSFGRLTCVRGATT
jgi:ABC-type multidrug transport system fused ATPase/permease subunit